MRRAIAFLTPFGGAVAPNPRTLSWFPAVGAVIGAAIGSVWWAADRVFPSAVAAGLAVVTDLVLTGMLHFDGLIDAADGLLPHLTRERRLAVMAEPTVGAYGVTVGGAALLVRFAALASATPHVPVLAGIWCASRTAMAVTARAQPYARPGGLSDAFRGGDWRPVAVYGVVGALALAGLADHVHGLVDVATCLLTAALVVLLARRQLGGFTGDVLGAAGVVGETAALVVMAARW
jgi:adenosylcobinamide-GDP ribazoletransferase